MEGPAEASTRARAAVVTALLAVVTTLVIAVDGRTASGAPVEPATPRPQARAAAGVALVRVEGGPTRAHALRGRHGITTVEPLLGSAYAKVEAPGRSVAALVGALQRDADVVDAEPDYAFRAAEIPDDPWLPQQTFFARINATESWNVGDASNVPVAVLDSGVDLNHPDLVGRLRPGHDFVDNDSVPEDEYGHGTAVAGVVGAATNNGTGVASVGNGAPIIPVRVLDENGETFSSTLINGMNWAVANGAKVLNLSLGGPSGNSALEAAVNSAIGNGVVVVAAAGNDRVIDPAGAENPSFPARYPNVISVGSTNASNTISDFSNLRADVVAPGEDILTTGWDPTDSRSLPYEYWDGTSFSTPIVSGLVARMLVVTPGRAPAQIESDLESTAYDLGAAGTDTTYGAGIVDAHLALSPARTGTSDTVDGYEPNQLMGQAATLSAFPLTAAFGGRGDVDWYDIVPPGGAGVWQVTVTPSSGVDPVLTVFEADGDAIDEKDANGAGAVEQAGISSNGSTPHLVRVTNARATTGSYTLSLTSGGSSFTGALAEAPVSSSSIPDRSTGVPTNVTFVLTSPVALSTNSVTTNSVNAVVSSGGAVRATSVSLDSARTRVTATFALASGQDYALTVRGWRAGNNAPLRNSEPLRFSTGGAPSAPASPTTTTTTTAPPQPAPTAPPAPIASPPKVPERAGYWMVGRTGDVYAFGDARWSGNAPVPAGATATNIASTPTGNGYWIVAGNGSVYSFGDARFFGGNPVLVPGEVTTSISATPDGGGYWLFSNVGRVFAYGSAPHLGDMTGTRLNGGVLGSVVTPSGRGYYMVAADGGIFSFGDAVFHGSMGGARLNGPVVGLAPDPDGAGYWLVATDGGIFSFSATFRGSMGSVRLNQPMIGMVAYGDGYLMVASDGGIFTFSSKPFSGSLGANPPAQPIVAVSPLPD